MVKIILAACAATFISLLMWGCDGGFNLEQLVPWYVPYVKTTIDATDLLPTQYRDKEILVTRLIGPDAKDPTVTTAYIIVAQDRSPDPPMIAIFDSGMILKLVVTNQNVETPIDWFIDARGAIQLGSNESGTPSGITIAPPATASAGWQVISPCNLPANFSTGSLFFTNIPKSPPQTIFSLPFSNSALFSGQSNTGPTWGSVVPVSGTLAYPITNFNTANFPALFPGISGINLDHYNVRKFSPDFSNPAAPVLNIFLSAYIYDSNSIFYDSPIFCFHIPYTDLQLGNSNNATYTIFDTSGMPTSTSGSNQSGNFAYESCVQTPTGYVSTLPTIWGNQGTQLLPMVFNSPTGTKIASMVLTMPTFPSEGSSTNNAPAFSSISQRPYYLTGTSDFIVVDGFHKQLVLCTGWWQ